MNAVNKNGKSTKEIKGRTNNKYSMLDEKEEEIEQQRDANDGSDDINIDYDNINDKRDITIID